jgi:hypothetical protein
MLKSGGWGGLRISAVRVLISDRWRAPYENCFALPENGGMGVTSALFEIKEEIPIQRSRHERPFRFRTRS